MTNWTLSHKKIDNHIPQSTYPFSAFHIVYVFVFIELLPYFRIDKRWKQRSDNTLLFYSLHTHRNFCWSISHLDFSFSRWTIKSINFNFWFNINWFRMNSFFFFKLSFYIFYSIPKIQYNNNAITSSSTAKTMCHKYSWPKQITILLMNILIIIFVVVLISIQPNFFLYRLYSFTFLTFLLFLCLSVCISLSHTHTHTFVSLTDCSLECLYIFINIDNYTYLYKNEVNDRTTIHNNTIT